MPPGASTTRRRDDETAKRLETRETTTIPVCQCANIPTVINRGFSQGNPFSCYTRYSQNKRQTQLRSPTITTTTTITPSLLTKTRPHSLVDSSIRLVCRRLLFHHRQSPPTSTRRASRFQFPRLHLAVDLSFPLFRLRGFDILCQPQPSHRALLRLLLNASVRPAPVLAYAPAAASGKLLARFWNPSLHHRATVPARADFPQRHGTLPLLPRGLLHFNNHPLLLN